MIRCLHEDWTMHRLHVVPNLEEIKGDREIKKGEKGEGKMMVRFTVAVVGLLYHGPWVLAG